MSRPLFLAIAATVSLLGAGCWKQITPKAIDPQSAQAQAGGILPAELLPPEPQVAKMPAEKLGEALMRFREHKSFRAKLNMPGAQLPMTGTIEYSRPSRMRASINIGDKDVMDIIIAGANAYERENGGQWLNMTDLPEGIKLSNMLYGLTSGKMSLANYGVNKNDKVSEERDDEHTCDLFIAELKGKDGKPSTANVCVSDGLVRYVKIDTKDNGPVTFEYYDHDVLFLIERPI